MTNNNRSCNNSIGYSIGLLSHHNYISLPLLLLQIHGDATIVFPLLVAETFAHNYKTPPPLTVNGLDSNTAD